MITPSFGLTATERVIPKLALDFTTGLLDSRITFTRTTGSSNPATYVNSSGLITEATNNQPRFDYDPTTLLCKGLLIEESRTNLVLQSSDVSQSPWVPAGTGIALAPIVTQNAGQSPTGANNAVRVQFDCTDTSSSTNRSRVTQTIAVTNGTTYSRGIWIKAYDANSVGKTIRFATDNIGANLIYTLTNQWTRINPASAAATSTSTVITLETRGTFTTQTADVLLWNATLEAGAFLTSDIPTTTTALTRNADVATMTGTNFSDWFNASEGTFVVQSTIANTTTIAPVQIDDGTNNNRFYTVGRLNTISGTAAGVVNGGVIQANIGNFTFATTSKIALAYKANNFAASVDGANSITDTSGTIPTVDRLKFMYNNTTYGTGLIQSFRYWPQRLTNAEVQAISKG